MHPGSARGTQPTSQQIAPFQPFAAAPNNPFAQPAVPPSPGPRAEQARLASGLAAGAYPSDFRPITEDDISDDDDLSDIDENEELGEALMDRAFALREAQRPAKTVRVLPKIAATLPGPLGATKLPQEQGGESLRIRCPGGERWTKLAKYGPDGCTWSLTKFDKL